MSAPDALTDLDPHRNPLPARHPTTAEVKLADGRLAAIKRGGPTSSLKAKIALAKAAGPTLAKLLTEGVTITVDGVRRSMGVRDLMRLATQAGREAAGLSLADVRSMVQAALPELLHHITGELDPEELDTLIAYFLVGRCAIQTPTGRLREDGSAELTAVPVLEAAQLDELLRDDVELGRMLWAAIELGMRPFVAQSLSPPTS